MGGVLSTATGSVIDRYVQTVRRQVVVVGIALVALEVDVHRSGTAGHDDLREIVRPEQFDHRLGVLEVVVLDEAGVMLGVD